MFTKRHWYFSLLFIVLAWSSAVAQNQPTTSAQTPAPDFNIMINRKSVRFTSQTQVLEWRVEVFSQTGELVFASGQQSNSELEWPLLDQQQKPVESGLYAYTLTIKNQASEGSYVQRGHVIVDRASAADRVWVTSDKSIGIGAGNDGSKLTVAGTNETTVGGADVSEKASRGLAEGRTSADRKVEAKATNDIAASTAATTADTTAPVTGAGMANQIAKWASGNMLGYSVITEATNGNIGIGALTPNAKLHVVASYGDGMYSQTNDSNGAGVSGINSGYGPGIKGVSLNGTGVYGVSNTAGPGVKGYSITGIGVIGTSGSNSAGVSGSASGNSGTGVSGSASNVAGTGVSGSGWIGVTGISTADNGIGLYGVANPNSMGNGVVGYSNKGFGVSGGTTTGVGVFGSSIGNGVAMKALGNAQQSRDKGGWVKAMFRYNAAGISCFQGDEFANPANANTCTLFSRTTGPNGPGESIITFPLTVNDRFIVVSTQYGGSSGNVSAVYEFLPDQNQIVVRTFLNGKLADFGFTLVVF